MTTPNPQAWDRKFDRFRRSIDLLRTFESEIPGQVISVFFYVCAHNGCPTNVMPKHLGMAQSSISRCTDWLSDYHRLGKPGMDLITKKIDPSDRRIRRLYLTPKGELVKLQIEELLSNV
jgi:DNA-binding MarR family transcriptional regulator